MKELLCHIDNLIIHFSPWRIISLSDIISINLPLVTQTCSDSKSIKTGLLLQLYTLRSNSNVNVCDSLNDTVNKQKRDIITSLFAIWSIDIIPIHKQPALEDCGLYSIAICVSLAFNLKPELLKFDQSVMTGHLIRCIETEPFPAATVLL